MTARRWVALGGLVLVLGVGVGTAAASTTTTTTTGPAAPVVIVQRGSSTNRWTMLAALASTAGVIVASASARKSIKLADASMRRLDDEAEQRRQEAEARRHAHLVITGEYQVPPPSNDGGASTRGRILTFTHQRGTSYFRVTNRGPAIARNVRLVAIETDFGDDDAKIDDERRARINWWDARLFPVDLHPGDGHLVPCGVSQGRAASITVGWDDQAGEGHQLTRVVTFPTVTR